MTTPESVIEIGSTGVRLLVCEFTSENQQNILDRSDMPLPLGKDVFTSGVISQDTQEKCIHLHQRANGPPLALWCLKPYSPGSEGARPPKTDQETAFLAVF